MRIALCALLTIALTGVVYAACVHNDPARDTCGADCNCGCVPGGSNSLQFQRQFTPMIYREIMRPRRRVIRYYSPWRTQSRYERQWFDVGEQNNRLSFSLVSFF